MREKRGKKETGGTREEKDMKVIAKRVPSRPGKYGWSEIRLDTEKSDNLTVILSLIYSFSYVNASTLIGRFLTKSNGKRESFMVHWRLSTPCSVQPAPCDCVKYANSGIFQKCPCPKMQNVQEIK